MQEAIASNRDEPVPTPQDRETARIRQDIADRQAHEYGRVLAWAAALGEGWLPSHRHFLVDNAEEERARRTGERARPAATVYTVKNVAGDRRHYTVESGRVIECASYEQGFGAMLWEPDLTRTAEIRGQQVHLHRYSLCWAPFELYHPLTAEQLAVLRASREKRRREREEKRWAEENTLFAAAAKGPLL